MATIKSYTDLPQSKKLAEILPLESADAFYIIGKEPVDIVVICGFVTHEHLKEQIAYKRAIPCWSLSALLGVLPNDENISISLSKGGYRISTLKHTDDWFVDYEDESDGLNNCVTSANNPIDACYKMILKLHELILL